MWRWSVGKNLHVMVFAVDAMYHCQSLIAMGSWFFLGLSVSLFEQLFIRSTVKYSKVHHLIEFTVTSAFAPTYL